MSVPRSPEPNGRGFELSCTSWGIRELTESEGKKPLADTYVSRDFPVLVEVTRRIDAGARNVRSTDIASALDRDHSEVCLALRALARQDLLEVKWPMAVDSFGMVTDDSGRAYQLTGLHPDGDDLLEQLSSVVKQLEDKTSDEDDRSALRKFRQSLVELPSQVALTLFTVWVDRNLGA